MSIPAIKQEELVYSINPVTKLVEARTQDGVLVSVQQSIDEIIHTNPANMTEVELSCGTKILTSPNLDVGHLRSSKYKFHKAIGDVICQMLMQGKTIREICELDGFPAYSTICQWRIKHEDFAKAFDMARQFRAETFHDQIIDELATLEHIGDKIELSAKQTKIDTLKWLTERNDAKRYGAGGRDKGDVNGGGNIKIVVNTGINRDTESVINIEHDTITIGES